MSYIDLINQLDNSKLNYIEFNKIWYTFISKYYKETISTNKNKKLIKRLLDKSILYFNNSSNNNLNFLNEVKDILNYEYENKNKFELINNGTMLLVINLYIKNNKINDLLYLYNLIRITTQISQRVNFKIIDILKTISNQDDILFHCFNSLFDLENDNYLITNKEIGQLIQIYHNHSVFCKFSIQDLIVNLLHKCIYKFWYIKLDKTSIETIPSFNILHYNKPVCSVCNQTIKINHIPNKIKKILKVELIQNKMNRVTKFINTLNLDFSLQNCVYVFDGANIGYYKQNQTTLDINRINTALNYNTWKSKTKYLILHERHSNCINKISSDNTNIIFTKNIDDDLISLYLWLSLKNAFLISNDKFRIYSQYFQKNKYLTKCWDELKDVYKINYYIKKDTFHFNKTNSFLINWDKNNNFIHFPILDYNNLNTIYYCCHKVNK